MAETMIMAIQAILIAVMLALLRFIQVTSRPRVEILGRVHGLPGFHAVARHPTAQTYPGLLLFRFNAPLVFFNAPYFKRQTQAAIAAAGPALKGFVLDALPVTQVDVTGIDALLDLERDWRARGAGLLLAGRRTELRRWLDARGLLTPVPHVAHFPTLRQAVRALSGRADGAHRPVTTAPTS